MFSISVEDFNNEAAYNTYGHDFSNMQEAIDYLVDWAESQGATDYAGTILVEANPDDYPGQAFQPTMWDDVEPGLYIIELDGTIEPETPNQKINWDKVDTDIKVWDNLLKVFVPYTDDISYEDYIEGFDKGDDLYALYAHIEAYILRLCDLDAKYYDVNADTRAAMERDYKLYAHYIYKVVCSHLSVGEC